MFQGGPTIKYRSFNELEWQSSVLGLGTAALPADDAEAKNIIRLAVEGGVNYIASRYNDREEWACRLVGEAVGNNDEVRTCAGLPSRPDISQIDIFSFVDERLIWLRRERLDFLMLDGLNRDTWPAVRNSGIIADIEEAMAAGKVGALGFSFRDQFLYLRQIIEGYGGWTFCEFQYSFMDDDFRPGTSGLSYAAQKGLAVIASGPLKGGRLVRSIPPETGCLWESSPSERSPAAWALDWVWHHGQVSAAVVDMASEEEVKENLALAKKSRENGLTVQEEVLVSRVRDAYRARRPLPCTTCRACMPCHNGIDVPRIFELYNEAVMYGDNEVPRRLFHLEGHDITSCDDCGSCARACGRKIAIPEELRKAVEFLRG